MFDYVSGFKMQGFLWGSLTPISKLYEPIQEGENVLGNKSILFCSFFKLELTLSILPISMNIKDPMERLEYTANTIHERLSTAEFIVINNFMNLMGSLPRGIADPIYIDFT